MKFGTRPLNQSKGSILAHSLMLPDGKRLRKGISISQEVLSQLKDAGIKHITVAEPENNDVLEDKAATLIAKKFTANNLRIEEAATGRVNIFAGCNGVFRCFSDVINAINAIDPGITIATLPDYACVNEGRLIATIKIIPYAVAYEKLQEVLALNLSNALAIHALKPKRIGLISTTLPALKTSTLDKTRSNLERRLALSESSIIEELRVEHDEEAISGVINQISANCDMIIIFGASAISDIADCIPSAIQLAGGKVIRFGMPVDPGNLMLLAKLGDTPILGAPGCARSIAENGFDWVLNRLLADIEVTSQDVANLGVGGLLMETGARPHPRERKTKATSQISAIIMAAGQSRRMGKLNKMTVKIADKPMMRHVADAVASSCIKDISVITGHKPNDVQDAVKGLNISSHHNHDFEQGLSTSLFCGIKALNSDVSAALILLGDMPFITSKMIDQMAQTAFDNPDHIIVATHKGKRGNPVLWPRIFFDELCAIEGDVGARHIMAANQDKVIEVELGEAASLDLDTPEAVKRVEEKS